MGKGGPLHRLRGEGGGGEGVEGLQPGGEEGGNVL